MKRELNPLLTVFKTVALPNELFVRVSQTWLIAS